jgi:large subunit ribosomal protein L3
MKLKKLRLMGKKRGMIQLFDEKGQSQACTVIEMQPNLITQVKTDETDGYTAIQVGFDVVETKDPRTVEKRVSKPLLGHFKKAGVKPCRHICESNLDSVEGYSLGQEIGVEKFEGIAYVDATAISKGKGYQGVMKRHNFAGGPAAHGSGFHRHGGSTGMRTTPGRGLPGQKMAGQMGNEQVTVQNLRVVLLDTTEKLLVVEGTVPGPCDGLVYVSSSIKGKGLKKSRGKKS